MLVCCQGVKQYVTLKLFATKIYIWGHSMSNHPMVETVPPPDFYENLHIWSIWSEKKICQIIAYLVKYFPRYGPLKVIVTYLDSRFSCFIIFFG